MKQITIRYFALLKDERGLSSELINTEVTTAGELYRELRARYRFKLDQDQMKVAINRTFAEWDTPLAALDEVVFIPPVAGG